MVRADPSGPAPHRQGRCALRVTARSAATAAPAPAREPADRRLAAAIRSRAGLWRVAARCWSVDRVREIFETLSRRPHTIDLIVVIPWHSVFGGSWESASTSLGASKCKRWLPSLAGGSTVLVGGPTRSHARAGPEAEGVRAGGRVDDASFRRPRTQRQLVVELVRGEIHDGDLLDAEERAELARALEAALAEEEAHQLAARRRSRRRLATSPGAPARRR